MLASISTTCQVSIMFVTIKHVLIRCSIYGKIQTNYAAIRPYGGIIDALEQVYNKEGIRGLFRGWFVNWLSFLAPTLLQGLYVPFLSRTIMRKHGTYLAEAKRFLGTVLMYFDVSIAAVRLEAVALPRHSICSDTNGHNSTRLHRRSNDITEYVNHYIYIGNDC